MCSQFVFVQQTCLLCPTADMSAGIHGRHACGVTQHTYLLCHTAEVLCCVTQQTCLLRHTADMSAVDTVDTSAASHSRRVCCTQQTCLLCHTAHMSAA